LSDNPDVSCLDVQEGKRLLLKVQFKQEFPVFEIYELNGQFVCGFQFCGPDEAHFKKVLAEELKRQSVRILGDDREIDLFRNAIY
jgi:hypothetical protein